MSFLKTTESIVPQTAAISRDGLPAAAARVLCNRTLTCRVELDVGPRARERTVERNTTLDPKGLINAYNSLHQEYTYQYEMAQFHTDSNDVQWYTLGEENMDRRNLKSHQISILYLGYSVDKSAKHI